MAIRFHPHALERMAERGATKAEITETIHQGERFPAKHNRAGFRRNFLLSGNIRGKKYSTKQIEAYAVKENSDWTVITVIVKYF